MVIPGAKNFIIASLGMLIVGCMHGSDPYSSQNKNDTVPLQHSGDKRSVLIPPRESSVVSEIKENAEDKLKKGNDKFHLLNASKIAVADGRYDEAEEFIKEALKVDLDFKAARLVLAQLNVAKKNFQLADLILTSLGGWKSKNPDVQNASGIVRFHQGKIPEALAHFKKGLQLDSDHVAIRMNLGVAYLEYRQIDLAQRQIERVLKIMPDHNDAKIYLSMIKAIRGGASAAVEQLAKIEVHKDKVLYQFNYASALAASSDYDAAEEVLDEYLATKEAKVRKNDRVFGLMERIDRDRIINKKTPEIVGNSPEAGKSNITKASTGEDEEEDSIKALERELIQ